MAIEFRCSQCNQLLRVSDASAGKNARCPKCQTLMTVPAAADPAAPAPADPFTSPPAAGTSPVFSPAPSPLPSGPAAAKDPFSFLDSGTGGGSPTASSPPTSPFSPPPTSFPSPPAKAGDNPFGDAPSPSPFGGPAVGNVNPYASPSAYAAYSPPAGFAAQRTGLPWETEPRTLGCWFRTLGIILGSPSRAFSMMQQSGGLGPPILYNMYGLGMPLLLIALLIIGGMVIIAIVVAANGNANNAAAGVGVMLGVAIGIAFVLAVYVVLATTVGNLIAAGIWHLFLMMCGGARQGYETTFRVTSFVYGSLAWLSFIPYIGGFAMLIWMVVLLIIGFAKAHEIPTGKAALAVLLPFGLCIGAYVLLIVALISTAAFSN